MSGVVSFYWLDDDEDAHYVRVPRELVIAVRYASSEIEVQLSGTYQDVSISVDPTDSNDEDHDRKLAIKMIDSIRALTDEDVSWEWSGDRWEKKKAKNHGVWGAS